MDDTKSERQPVEFNRKKYFLLNFTYQIVTESFDVFSSQHRTERDVEIIELLLKINLTSIITLLLT